MTLQKYLFKSGVNKENTRYTNEGGWWETQWVRFRSGTPEKMGGWQKSTLSAFSGVCRALYNWVDLDNDNILAIGTNQRLYGERGGAIFDITPAISSYTASNIITTVDGSTTVTVDFPAHGAGYGDTLVLSGVTSPGVGGIPNTVLNGEHFITNAGNANQLQFVSPVAATSSATGGGSVSALVLLPAGPEYASGGTGWGAGPWVSATQTGATAVTTAVLSNTATTVPVNSTTGFTSTGYILVEGELISYAGITSTSFTGCTRAVGQTNPTAASTPEHASDAAVYQCTINFNRGWGTGADTAAGSSNQLRLWSFDNFGENLLANVVGGEIYYWEPGNGYTSANRAIPLSELPDASDTPLFSNCVVSTDERHVVAFGANPLNEVYQDPLLIRWSDQEDPAMWTPTATNSAGDIRVPIGSYIVGAQQTRQETLVFTDASLHSLQYIGAPYVFSLQTLSNNTSLIGPNAVVTVNNITYWMGTDKFYAYSGRVETLPCSLRRFIYSDINLSQALQVTAGLNEQYGEIMWFYCSKNAVRIDKYVVYNYLENIWYYGDFSRTAWLDSHIRGAPFATSYDGYVYQHEFECDDGSTNPPTPVPAWIESADFDIDDGDRFSFIKRIIPDITFTNSTSDAPAVEYTLFARNFPGATFDQSNSRSVTAVTNEVDQYTNQMWTRVRGRQGAIRVESSALGVMWQLGSTRLDLRPDGRR